MATTTEVPIKTSGELMWVRADTLIVDPIYQRRIHANKVRKIVNEFDPDAFGVLYVSSRKSGEDVILDGQQRHAAVMAMEWGDQLVPAIVYTGLTAAQEAALFIMYNTVRTKPRPSDLYRAARAAGDASVLDIDRIIHGVGLALGEGLTEGDISGMGRVHSIAAVRRIYDNTPDGVLFRTLTVAQKAWDVRKEHRDALSGEMLVALASIIARHNPSDARLIHVLAKEQPTALLKRARVVMVEFGKVGGGHTNLASIVAGIVVKLYNSRFEPKIKYDVEATGNSFWRDASLPPSQGMKTKARRAIANTAQSLFTDEQLDAFFQMRVDGKRWAEVHAAATKASKEYADALHDTDTARNIVLAYAGRTGKELPMRTYKKKVRK